MPLGIAILVGFLYGTTLVFGVLPSFDQRISWDGHLFGAIAGAAVAYFNTRVIDVPVDSNVETV